jgi:hypothetical protein
LRTTEKYGCLRSRFFFAYAGKSFLSELRYAIRAFGEFTLPSIR